jgi:hypothetical protein
MIKVFCDRCGKEIKGDVNEFTNTMEGIARGKIVATWKSVEHICDECKQKDLTCGFKVGDKVVTADGKKGKIISICKCLKCNERGFYEPKVEFNDGDTDYITVTDKNDGFKSYYSIGDQIFGNLNEESVIRELNDISCRRAQLEEQLGTLLVLKQVRKNKNGN